MDLLFHLTNYTLLVTGVLHQEELDRPEVLLLAD